MASRRIQERSVLDHFAKMVVMVVMVASCVDAADPDPLQDFCVADTTSWTRVNGYPCRDPPKVRNEDLVYRGLRHGGNTAMYLGAPITMAYVQQWPALNTQGISWARIDFAPDGLNTLHWHPRASEIFYCEEGTIQVGFVDLQLRLWQNTLQPGDLAVFPRALLHFNHNVGKGRAKAQMALNSQYAGLMREGDSTFGSIPPIPHSVLRKAFDLDEATVLRLEHFFHSPHLHAAAVA